MKRGQIPEAVREAARLNFEAGRRSMFGDTSTATQTVLTMVAKERQSQEARYGDTNDLVRSGTGPNTAWLLPYTSDGAKQIQLKLREDYEDWEEDAGLPTWAHLVREEICEAFELEEGDPRLVPELIQVAALCVSWVERLIDKEAQQ